MSKGATAKRGRRGPKLDYMLRVTQRTGRAPGSSALSLGGRAREISRRFATFFFRGAEAPRFYRRKSAALPFGSAQGKNTAALHSLPRISERYGFGGRVDGGVNEEPDTGVDGVEVGPA